MSDLALNLIDPIGVDLQLGADGTLVRDDGLETAVIISLFSDQRVAESELPPGVTSRKGWWGDEFLPNPGDQYGSKIWTFARDKSLPQTAGSVQVRAKQALQWMLDDGVASTVEVAAEARGDIIVFEIKIKQPDGTPSRFVMFWDGQSLRR